MGADAVVARGARRELVLGALVAVAAGRLSEGPAPWAVAMLVAGAVVAGGLHIAASGTRGSAGRRAAVRSQIVPAVAAYASVGAIRLVPVGIALVPALFAAWLLLERTLRSEARVAAAGDAPGEHARTAVLADILVVAFLAFIGTAALVPGGLSEPGAGAGTLTESGLVLLAGVDALVAGLLGYRAMTLRGALPRAAAGSAATYAGAVAIAAAAVRATDIPRLVGPALLTLVFFLWDTLHGAPPARRQDPRWIWQTVLLAVLGILVVVWNLALRPG